MEKQEIKTKKAFTLVELIIVITILAVLATIAFVSFQNYTKSSRDANRISTLKSIEKGLNLYNIKSNTYPNPEESVEILGTGSVILSKQGIIGNEITQIIKLNKQALDPKDKTNYVYSITGNGKKFQLGTFLEENKLNTYFPQILKTYATNIDYTNRYFYTMGDKVGILFEEETNKLVTKEEYTTGTLDLTQTNNQNKNFKIYFSNDTNSGSVTSSGINLITTIIEEQKTTQVKQQPKSCESTPHNGTKTFYKEESVPYLGTCSEGVEFICNDGKWEHSTENKQDYQYVLPCVVGEPKNCDGTTMSGYTLTQSDHGEIQTSTKPDTNFLNGTKILSQSFICNNENFQLEGTESYEITGCNAGYYNTGTSCETQWSGDSTNGYTFKDTSGTIQYPKNCNDLLLSTTPSFKITHTNSPWNSTNNKFINGLYWIKSDSGNAFKAYCDMTNDGGGWTRIYLSQTTQENYQRFRDCKNNGYYYETNFECINPNKFTNIKFTRSGYSNVTALASNMSWADVGGCINTGANCRVGWSYYPGGSSRYTMRDYNSSSSGYNTGRWGASASKIQNQIIIFGK